MIRKKLKSIFFEEETDKTFKERLKDFMKSPKELLSFFMPIIIAIIIIIPVPYTITVGGGTINIDEKIKVENSSKIQGSLNSAYVKELEGRVATYILAKIVPSYELNKLEEITLENETEEEYNYREKTYFTSSLDSATIVAYKKANKKISIKSISFTVLYISKEAETNLKIKDQILEIENKKIEDISDINNVINNFEVGDKLNVKVLRNNKEIECYFILGEIDNNKKIGIYINTKYVYNTAPKIEFNFSNRESGPSGGLMITLAIYNKLVEEDITKGKKIVGTGTIDIDGTVGEIGGIKEKLQGAVKSKADIFIVPKENYEEALAIKLKENYNIKLINVSTFDEALQKLKESFDE